VPPEGVAAKGPAKEGHFYGISTRSKRVLYLIDVSGSMTKVVDPHGKAALSETGGWENDPSRPAPGRTRMEIAQNELRRAIGRLPPGSRFSMIFYNHAVRLWAPELREATPKARKEALEAVAALRPSGATFTLGALREAFALAAKEGAEVDTIFLLSDGAPTDDSLPEAKVMDPGIILDAVRVWNRHGGIVIHTIAIDLPDTYFLKTLAAENGGVFVERRR
jgi:hypothetical protein